MRGRRRVYDNPVFVGLRCEAFYQNTMRCLKVADTDVYVRGARDIMEERAAELSPEQLERHIQTLRSDMKVLQDRIALFERVTLDARIREEARKRKRIIMVPDERGNLVEGVLAD